MPKPAFEGPIDGHGNNLFEPNEIEQARSEELPSDSKSELEAKKDEPAA